MVRADLTCPAGADPRHPFADLLVTGEQVAGFIAEDLSGRRESHSPARALEQHDIELRLEASNQLAHGGLGDVEPSRRLPEVQLLRDGKEGAEVS